MKAVILSTLFICACGPDAYTTQGIPVYYHDAAAKVDSATLSKIVSITLSTAREIRGLSRKQTDTDQNDLMIELYAHPVNCYGVKSSGCYSDPVIYLQVRQEQACVASDIQLDHELVHWLGAVVDGDADTEHTNQQMFGAPESIERISDQRVRDQLCGSSS